MYKVYVLKSLKTGKYYKGQCSDLDLRLHQHNSGYTKSTKHGIPWKLIYSENHSTREEALEREKYFKTAAGRRYLKGKLTE